MCIGFGDLEVVRGGFKIYMLGLHVVLSGSGDPMPWDWGSCDVWEALRSFSRNQHGNC